MNSCAVEPAHRDVALPPAGRSRIALASLIVAVAGIFVACTQGASIFQRNTDARHLTATLRMQFAHAVDAAHRAVMADSDASSGKFAGEAANAREQVKQTASELVPLLRGLGYADELKLLEEFGATFAAYEVLDRSILELAVDNTNLKATRTSFGPSNDAAEAFANSLQAVVAAAGREAWQIRALTSEAQLGVRTIQALQAPHIAEASDIVMSRLEEKMTDAETASRRALSELSRLVLPAQTEAATAALDEFIKLNGDVIALSRRNTRVRSLAMTLGQKRTLVGSCEESLRALSGSLTKRVSKPSR